eukprot:COSAG02_NODE_11261_length_1758_cov_1.482821_2_plen_214_part_00
MMDPLARSSSSRCPANRKALLDCMYYYSIRIVHVHVPYLGSNLCTTAVDLREYGRRSDPWSDPFWRPLARGDTRRRVPARRKAAGAGGGRGRRGRISAGAGLRDAPVSALTGGIESSSEACALLLFSTPLTGGVRPRSTLAMLSVPFRSLLLRTHWSGLRGFPAGKGSIASASSPDWVLGSVRSIRGFCRDSKNSDNSGANGSGLQPPQGRFR